MSEKCFDRGSRRCCGSTQEKGTGACTDGQEPQSSLPVVRNEDTQDQLSAVAYTFSIHWLKQWRLTPARPAPQAFPFMWNVPGQDPYHSCATGLSLNRSVIMIYSFTHACISQQLLKTCCVLGTVSGPVLIPQESNM